MDLSTYIRSLPKAELHLHIEGTLEPEMMMQLAVRNGIDLPFTSVDEIREAYEFNSLQSFLDLYYQGAAVLITEDDFYDLMIAYLERANADGVRRAEIFFDPQTHTSRGVEFSVFMDGFLRAMDDASQRWGISSGLIMCFLRHLPEEDAISTWNASEPYRERLLGVGLDSSEVGYPPELFVNVFAMARDAGLRIVAHAGEEGPPEYVEGAIEALGVERIDHGIRSSEDDELLNMIVRDRIPLTMCPLSNVRLDVFDRIEDHNLGHFLEKGALVTVNSDDPAYFGGYVLENYLVLAVGLNLSRDDLAQLARNSIEASFISDTEKAELIEECDSLSDSITKESP